MKYENINVNIVIIKNKNGKIGKNLFSFVLSLLRRETMLSC